MGAEMKGDIFLGKHGAGAGRGGAGDHTGRQATVGEGERGSPLLQGTVADTRVCKCSWGPRTTACGGSWCLSSYFSRRGLS